MKPLPNGWGNILLGQIMDFKNGLNTDKSQYGKGLKFVNVMDIFGNDILTEEKIIGRVQVSENRIEDNLLMFGDILFNRTSETFDEIAMSAVYMDDKPAVFGGFVIRGRLKDAVLTPSFSVYAFASNNFRNQVIKLGQGAVRANIGQKDLANVYLLIPPLPEQTKIAQILGTWDNAIRTTEQLIANSELQKQALMQQLLTGKKRLLNDNGERFCGEWKRNVLKNILQISKGKQLNRSTLSKNGDYPVINGGITPSGYTERFNTNANTITISEGGNSCGFVAYQKRNFWCGGHCYAIINLKLNLAFTYHLLKFNEAQIMNLRVGSGLPNIQKKALEDFNVCYPMFLKEQQKIAAVLTAADNEIETLKQTLCRLKTEKQALMQQLLTGRLRVSF